MVVLLLALLSACSDPPPESGPVAQSPVARDGAVTPIVEVDASVPPETDLLVTEGVVGSIASSASGHRHAWSRKVEGAMSTELVVEEAGEEHIVVSEGNPDRPALSPDGQWLAYVSAESGWASVYVLAFDGGEPLQVSNVGLQPHKGEGMPPGWTAPPMDESLAFDGDALVWDSPEGTHKMVWR